MFKYDEEARRLATHAVDKGFDQAVRLGWARSRVCPGGLRTAAPRGRSGSPSASSSTCRSNTPRIATCKPRASSSSNGCTMEPQR